MSTPPTLRRGTAHFTWSRSLVHGHGTVCQQNCVSQTSNWRNFDSYWKVFVYVRHLRLVTFVFERLINIRLLLLYYLYLYLVANDVCVAWRPGVPDPRGVELLQVPRGHVSRAAHRHSAAVPPRTVSDSSAIDVNSITHRWSRCCQRPTYSCSGTLPYLRGGQVVTPAQR